MNAIFKESFVVFVSRLADNKFTFKEKEADLLVHKILLEEVPW